MPREIHENRLSYPWIQFQLDHWTMATSPPKHEFKLHVSIPIANYAQCHEKIKNILCDAYNDGTINVFKMIDPALNMEESLEQCRQGVTVVDGQDPQKELEARERLFNNPFTIYIPEDVDVKKLALICNKIEYILSQVPIEKGTLSLADIPVSAHISLRKESLFGEYIPATASPFKLRLLRFFGQLSGLYRQLTHSISAQSSSPEGIPVPNEDEKIIDNVLNKINQHIEKLKKTDGLLWYPFMKSPEAKVQALEILKDNLLQCDKNNQKVEFTIDEWQKEFNNDLKENRNRFFSKKTTATEDFVQSLANVKP